jgi:endonuclease-3 related protein
MALRDVNFSGYRVLVTARLVGIYEALRGAYGPAGWWPGRSAFEVCLGAILTQNTAWMNVERTLRVLRRRGLLSFRSLNGLRASRLAPLLRASGTFRVKARRVRAFLDLLGREFGGRVSRMEREDPRRLRERLLGVHGIGPETADAIALYAAGHPFFVVDAYTRRVFERVGLLRGGESYAAVQSLFHRHLPRDAPLFNDYHAQLVRLAKEACRAIPLCARCPIQVMCEKRGVAEVRA